MYADHAFFSPSVHEHTSGKNTFTVRNTSSFVGTFGEQKLANVVAASVSGKPAKRNPDGSLTLLDLAETYQYVGWLTAGRWTVVKNETPEAPAAKSAATPKLNGGKPAAPAALPA